MRTLTITASSRAVCWVVRSQECLLSGVQGTPPPTTKTHYVYFGSGPTSWGSKSWVGAPNPNNIYGVIMYFPRFIMLKFSSSSLTSLCPNCFWVFPAPYPPSIHGDSQPLLLTYVLPWWNLDYMDGTGQHFSMIGVCSWVNKQTVEQVNAKTPKSSRRGHWK